MPPPVLTFYLTDHQDTSALCFPAALSRAGNRHYCCSYCTKWQYLLQTCGEIFLQHRIRGSTLDTQARFPLQVNTRESSVRDAVDTKLGAGKAASEAASFSTSLAGAWTTSTGWRFVTWRTCEGGKSSASHHFTDASLCPSSARRGKGCCSPQHPGTSHPLWGWPFVFLSDIMALG